MLVPYLSPSKIKTFEQCPLKYHAIYEEKLPEAAPHPLTIMGKSIHRAGELGIKALMDGDEVHFPGLVRKACASMGVSKPNSELAQELMQNALNWGYLRNVEHCVGTEVNFFEELPDGTKVKGIIDRLDLCPRFADVIDLKSQKRALDDETLKEDWQSVGYNWGVRKKFPEIAGDVRMSYWVLRHRVQRCTMTEDDAKLGQDLLMIKANEIRRCQSPEPNPSPLCPWCPKQPTCSASREGVKSKFKRKYK